jgi:hypothetical protein
MNLQRRPQQVPAGKKMFRSRDILDMSSTFEMERDLEVDLKTAAFTNVLQGMLTSNGLRPE